MLTHRILSGVAALLLSMIGGPAVAGTGSGETARIEASRRIERPIKDLSRRQGVYRVGDSGIRCVVGPCPSWEITSFDRRPFRVAAVNLSAVRGELQSIVLDGSVLVRGHYEVYDTAELDRGLEGSAFTFRAERILGDVQEFLHVQDSGIRCVKAPCPTWEVEDMDGRVRLATDVDLSLLELDDERASEVMTELYEGRWIVRGKLTRLPPGGSPWDSTVLLRVQQLVDPFDDHRGGEQ
jgi:hypothetical protein